MKKLILLLFVFLILVFSVNAAIDVSLDFPNSPSHSSTTDRIDFRCSGSGGTIFQIALYTDISGSWSQTGLNCTLQDSCTFTVLDIPEGDYEYNCKINDEYWETNNFQFTFTLVNDPPEFNGTLEDKTWEKNTILNNVWDLDDYFSDPNDDDIHYNAYGNSDILVEISSHGLVTLTPWTDWFGTNTINFSATDDKGAKVYSNNLVLTVTGDSTPQTEDCSNNIDDDNDGNIDCEDSDCVSSPNNCQDAICNTTSYDWEYTIKSSAECDSDSDCDSSEECDLSDCTCKEISSSDDEETCSEQDGDKCSSNEVCSGNWLTASDSSRCCSVTCTPKSESGLYIIKSHSPSSEKINLNIGDSKTFKVTPSGDTEVRWYLDEEKVGSGESYEFKPDKESKYELIAVIGDDPTLKNNDDFYMWIVTVGEEDILASNICGNDKVDEGENCGNCPRDVKCAKGERCVDDECVVSTGIFSRVSGFAVDTKDFVVEKWQYSSIIGGIIVALVIIGMVYAGKRRKKDVLHEFGKESFFSKIGKVFKRKGKKGYVTKKVEGKSTVEKQREVFIDKNPFSDDKKL